MTSPKLLVAAAAALTLSACMGPAHQGDRAMGATSSTMPDRNAPRSVSESHPSGREHQAPMGARGDNPNLPNPRTPSSPNESAAQPQSSTR